MKAASPQLDPQELELLSDAEVLPRKHRVQHKLEKILFQTGIELQTMPLALPWPSKPPKLSRGENYEQQAYRVMDFPRIQSEGDFLLYRTLILWGHPIGMHLIASGHFMESLKPVLRAQYHTLGSQWRYAAQDTPWIWEAQASGLLACSQLSKTHLIAEMDKRKFIKLSSFHPLAQYTDLPSLSQTRFAELHTKLIEPLLDKR